MALTGQTEAQAPHLMHSLLIIYTLLSPPLFQFIIIIPYFFYLQCTLYLKKNKLQYLDEHNIYVY